LWLRWTNCFAVDAEARGKTLTIAARHIRRQKTAKPLLDDIRRKIDAAQSVALPSSSLSKACQYALKLWKKLTRFLEYPELELSTNLAENSMRPVALGRRIGCTSAAHKRDRRLRRFSRSWKAAVGCKSPRAIIFPRFFPGLPIFRSGVFQTLLPRCGLPGIHRLKRPEYYRVVFATKNIVFCSPTNLLLLERMFANG
jgi:hypothetical protein